MVNNKDLEKKEALYGLCKSGSVRDFEKFYSDFDDLDVIEPWSGDPALALAAECGRKEIVEYLLNKGADVNRLGRHGKSALIKAAEKGHTGIARLLIEKGAKPDIKERELNRTALSTAAQIGDIELVTLLLSSGARVDPRGQGRSALTEAAGKGHIEIAGLLLENGADINRMEFHSPLMAAISGKSPEMIRFLLRKGADPYIQNEYGDSAVSEAFQSSETEIVKIFLEFGIRTDVICRDGDTLLMRAARFAGAGTVKLLLQHGANVNAQNDKGKTALQMAAEAGDVEVLKVLLEAGEVRINYKDDYVGQTALCRAVGGKHIAAARYLLDHGADPNVRDNLGGVALHEAGFHGAQEMVELLLSSGADIRIRNRDYALSIDIARQFGGNQEMVVFLEQHYNDDSKDAREEIFKIIEKGTDEEVHRVMSEYDGGLEADINGWTPLMHLLWHDRDEAVFAMPAIEIILDQADLFGVTPLMLAAKKNKDKIAAFLIERGAGVNAVDCYGNSVLTWALRGQSTACMARLIESGADINHVGNLDAAPLIEALLNRQSYKIEIVDLLLRSGADTDGVSRRGETALMLAVLTGDVKLVELVAGYSTNIDAKSDLGLTALMYAVNGRNQKMVRALVKAGADPAVKNASGLTAAEMSKSKAINKLLGEQPL